MPFPPRAFLPESASGLWRACRLESAFVLGLNFGDCQRTFMQKRFEGREIREAQSGFLDATLRDLTYRAMAPHENEPQARRLHPSSRAHE
jgi:hypothetical protein